MFAHLDCSPRWRERLAEIAIPTLVVHGRKDSFFPIGNADALVRAIPDARLLVRDEMGTAIPEEPSTAIAAENRRV